MPTLKDSENIGYLLKKWHASTTFTFLIANSGIANYGHVWDPLQIQLHGVEGVPNTPIQPHSGGATANSMNLGTKSTDLVVILKGCSRNLFFNILLELGENYPPIHYTPSFLVMFRSQSSVLVLHTPSLLPLPPM